MSDRPACRVKPADQPAASLQHKKRTKTRDAECIGLLSDGFSVQVAINVTGLSHGDVATVWAGHIAHLRTAENAEHKRRRAKAEAEAGCNVYLDSAPEDARP